MRIGWIFKQFEAAVSNGGHGNEGRVSRGIGAWVLTLQIFSSVLGLLSEFNQLVCGRSQLPLQCIRQSVARLTSQHHKLLWISQLQWPTWTWVIFTASPVPFKFSCPSFDCTVGRSRLTQSFLPILVDFRWTLAL